MHPSLSVQGVALAIPPGVRAREASVCAPIPPLTRRRLCLFGTAGRLLKLAR
jgi:hypothetical protein